MPNITDRTERFAGKVGVITGGASGIGRAAALRFAAEGGRSIIVDRDRAYAEDVVARIAADGGVATFIEADLSHDAQTESLGRLVAEESDAVHVLVNGAVGPGGGRIETGDWRENWEPGSVVGLKAHALVTQTLLPLMKRDGAAIVNISSDGGLRGRPGGWIYDACKAALISLTKTMAAEFVDYDIRVNAIAPGWTVTEMHFRGHADPAARKAELEDMQSDTCIMGRLGRPDEIAAGILFLASDDASYITGTTLCVDGGRVGMAIR